MGNDFSTSPIYRDDEDQLDFVYTISTSKIVKYLLNPTFPDDPIRAEFGKLMEEGYQHVCYLLKIKGWQSLLMYDCESLEEFIEEEIYMYLEEHSELLREDELEEGQEIAKVFFQHGVCGLTPKTRVREAFKSHFVFAKADLRSEYGTLYEFKTYPINEYAELQAKIFSWVYNEPVHLVGWDGDKIEEVVLNSVNINFKNIPNEFWEIEPLQMLLSYSKPFIREYGYYRTFL
ncbi:MAG: hypothetical protein GF364_07165 [Candidatus Lokiarchaeota archaeon]|nr:hypothetical protein [Candidatus Lokiarchaeota archaeon]